MDRNALESATIEEVSRRNEFSQKFGTEIFENRRIPLFSGAETIKTRVKNNFIRGRG